MSRLYRTFYRFYFHEDLIDIPLLFEEEEREPIERKTPSEPIFANFIKKKGKYLVASDRDFLDLGILLFVSKRGPDFRSAVFSSFRKLLYNSETTNVFEYKENVTYLNRRAMLAFYKTLEDSLNYESSIKYREELRKHFKFYPYFWDDKAKKNTIIDNKLTNKFA